MDRPASEHLNIAEGTATLLMECFSSFTPLLVTINVATLVSLVMRLRARRLGWSGLGGLLYRAILIST